MGRRLSIFSEIDTINRFKSASFNRESNQEREELIFRTLSYFPLLWHSFANEKTKSSLSSHCAYNNLNCPGFECSLSFEHSNAELRENRRLNSLELSGHSFLAALLNFPLGQAATLATGSLVASVLVWTEDTRESIFSFKRKGEKKGKKERKPMTSLLGARLVVSMPGVGVGIDYRFGLNLRN